MFLLGMQITVVIAITIFAELGLFRLLELFTSRQHHLSLKDFIYYTQLHRLL
jgi:hypothetical protein